MQCRNVPSRNHSRRKTETLDTEVETNGDTHLSPNLLCRLLFSSRQVLAECEGLGRHGGPVLPASAETAAETRLGQRGRQRHCLAFRASFHLWPVRPAPSRACLLDRCPVDITQPFPFCLYLGISLKVWQEKILCEPPLQPHLHGNLHTFAQLCSIRNLKGRCDHSIHLLSVTLAPAYTLAAVKHTTFTLYWCLWVPLNRKRCRQSGRSLKDLRSVVELTKQHHPVDESHKTAERPLGLSQPWHLEGQRLFWRTGASPCCNRAEQTTSSSLEAHPSIMIATFSLLFLCLWIKNPLKRGHFWWQDGGDAALRAMLTMEHLVHLTFLFDLWCTFFEVILCFVLFFCGRIQLEWSYSEVWDTYVLALFFLAGLLGEHMLHGSRRLQLLLELPGR